MTPYFDVFPCGDRARYLRQQNRRKLFQSFNYLLRSLEEACGWPQGPKILAKDHGFFEINLMNAKLIEAVEANQLSPEGLRTYLSYLHDIKKHGRDLHMFNDMDPIFPAGIWPLIHTELQKEVPGIAVNKPCTPEALEQAKERMTQAIQVIKQVPAFYEEMRALVNYILFIDSDKLVAGSCFYLLTFLFFRSGDTWQVYCENLVHETAHQYLFQCSTFDQLCENPHEDRYASPLRKDPRPMMGIFHAVFVLCRILLFYYSLARQNHAIHTSERIELLKARFQDGVETVQKYGKLTALAQRILESCQGQFKQLEKAF